MVLEPEKELGTRIVQLIQQETPYQALLATNLLQAHRLLKHIVSDCLVLADETFLPEELECLHSQAKKSKALRHSSYLSSTYSPAQMHNMKSVVKAVHLLLSVQHAL